MPVNSFRRVFVRYQYLVPICGTDECGGQRLRLKACLRNWDFPAPEKIARRFPRVLSKRRGFGWYTQVLQQKTEPDPRGIET